MDVKQTLCVSSGKKKSHNIRDCYIIVRNVTSFLLKLPTFHIPIGKSHKEFKNLISVRGFFFLFFHAKFLHGQSISTVFMMMLFSLVDIYLTVINKNPLSESSLSWGSMFLWYYISKAVYWMCSGLIFFFLIWTWKAICITDEVSPYTVLWALTVSMGFSMWGWHAPQSACTVFLSP